MLMGCPSIASIALPNSHTANATLTTPVVDLAALMLPDEFVQRFPFFFNPNRASVPMLPFPLA
jgi:hypothetical protein